jgi:hypothetical protein
MPRPLSMAAFVAYSGALAALAVAGLWIVLAVVACVGAPLTLVMYRRSYRGRCVAPPARVGAHISS